MEKFFHVSLLLCALIAGGSEAQVVASGVRLTKYTREHSSLNLGDEDLSYILECMYTAPAGSITKIAWSLEGYDHYVYVWDAETNTVNVDEPLLTHVETDTDDTKIGPNIQFTTPNIRMRGLYTCIISHNIEEEKVNPVIYSFDLQMYYFDNTPFKMAASLEGCNVYVNYTTNFLYPKPEVTCGFWNASGGHSISTVSGGLLFRQMLNGIWQISMERTQFEVKDIPRDSLLFCDVNLPIANYTTHTLLERNADNQDVYQAIDARGCDADLKDIIPHMEVSFLSCKLNCRNECQQISRYPPVAQFGCGREHYAYWPKNRSSNHVWEFEATCGSSQHLWFAEKYKLLEFSDLPLCLRSGSGGFSSSLLLVTLTSLLVNRLIS